MKLPFFRRKVELVKPESVEIDRAWAKELCQRVEFTPDAHVLNRTMYQLYFAYGAEQRTHPLFERLIEPHCMNNRPLADVFTETPYTMVKKKLGYASVPVVTDLRLWNTPQLRIRGQLFALRSYMFPELDKCYLNTVEFERKRIQVTCPHHLIMWSRKTGEHRIIKHNHITYQAWAYIGPGDYWKDQIDNGYLFGKVRVTDPNNHSQLQQYYHFTHAEYQHE